MAEEVKAGDVVKLKSGGIKMTVGGFTARVGVGKMAICYWSVNNPNEIKHLEIAVDALTADFDEKAEVSFR